MVVYSDVELRFDEGGEVVGDTFFTLANDGPGPITVVAWAINGDPPIPPGDGDSGEPGWNRFDHALTIGEGAIVSWSASEGGAGFGPWTELDPGPPPGRPDPERPGHTFIRGMLVAVAVTADQEAERHWNHLVGTATRVRYDEPAAREAPAWTFRAVDGAPGAALGTPGAIDLDGVEYARAFDLLAFAFPAAGATEWSNGPRTIVAEPGMTLHPVDLDLRRSEDPPIPSTRATFDVWNSNGVKFSGSYRCIACWDATGLASVGFPNFFTRDVLETDHGRVRIDADGNFPCADAEPRALLGTAWRRLHFVPTQAFAEVASAPVGMGGESARISWEPGASGGS